jgi:hypothetical protein
MSRLDWMHRARTWEAGAREILEGKGDGELTQARLAQRVERLQKEVAELPLDDVKAKLVPHVRNALRLGDEGRWDDAHAELDQVRQVLTAAWKRLSDERVQDEDWTRRLGVVLDQINRVPDRTTKDRLMGSYRHALEKRDEGRREEIEKAVADLERVVQEVLRRLGH